MNDFIPTLGILPCWETTPALRKPMILLRYHNKTLPRGRDARMPSMYACSFVTRQAYTFACEQEHN